jgi:hypothetical protein
MGRRGAMAVNVWDTSASRDRSVAIATEVAHPRGTHANEHFDGRYELRVARSP